MHECTGGFTDMGIFRKTAALWMALSIICTCFTPAVIADDTSYIPVEVAYHQDDARSMLALINQLRTSDEAWVWNSSDSEKIYYSDLNELVYDYELEKAAMQRAAELVLSISHTRPDGSACNTAYPAAFACSYWGENIAYGYTTASSVFTAWKEDDESYYGQGHRRNMLRENFKSVGMACVEYGGRRYWVQEFSSKTVSSTQLTYSTDTVSVNVPVYASDGRLSLSFKSTAYANNPIINIDRRATVTVPEITGKFYYQDELYGTVDRFSSITSNDNSVVKEEKGKITGLKAGNAQITYTANFGSFSGTLNLNVRVSDQLMRFNDVKNTSKYYYDPVYWALDHQPVQITTGTDDYIFSPDLNVTRGQMVTFLYRLAGCPKPAQSALFSDVKKKAYYADAVAWAAENSITTGYNDGSNQFGPDDLCTREQIVTFLWRYARQPQSETQSSFEDVDENTWYTDAAAWAAENEITTGVSENRFGVGENCTRAMAVTFLYRYENSVR